MYIFHLNNLKKFLQSIQKYFEVRNIVKTSLYVFKQIPTHIYFNVRTPH